MDNRQTLDTLWSQSGIEVARGHLFEHHPGPSSATASRIEGMMLGLAIGDSLGNTTEGRRPDDRLRRFGEIRQYTMGRRKKGELGAPSDDTQMAFWTLDQLNQDKGLVPEHLARRFASSAIFGIGQTVAAFRRNLRAGEHWTQCGPGSAGNGALMRIAPILIPHLRTGDTRLWADTALAAMMTHNDAASTASCLAFVAMLWELLEADAPPQPQWWLERWVSLTRDLECNGRYAPRGGQFMRFEGHLWEFVEEHVSAAFERQEPTLKACNSWYSGAYLLETVPCVLYILMQHGHDPQEAIVRAVNDTKDNDTVAAIVGAAVGALHGRQALDPAWIEGLTGRTTLNDHGRAFEILQEAIDLWLPSPQTP